MHTRSAKVVDNNVTTAKQTLLKGSVKKNVSITRRSTITNAKNIVHLELSTPSYVHPPNSPSSSSCTTIASSSPSPLPSPRVKLDFNPLPIQLATPIDIDTPSQKEQVKQSGPIPIPVGREHHHSNLYSLISNSLSASKSTRATYVCGTPGTGKTLTVKSVLSHLKHNHAEHTQLFHNCASVTSPTHLLSLIAESLNLQHEQQEIGQTLKYFAESDGKPILIIVDEIDLLISTSSNSQQNSSLYTLFELSSRKNSRISLLAIANAIDIPTRLLPLLSNSPESKPTTITFSPYTSSTLIQLIKPILSLSTAGINIPPLAVSLAAKKVAVSGGDARLMISVIRQTISLLKNGDKRSAVSIVSSVATNSSCKIISMIDSLPIHQQITVIVAANAVTLAGNGNTGMKRVRRRATLVGLYDSFKRMCERVNVRPVEWQEFTDFCTGALTQQAVLDVSHSRAGKSKGCGTLASKQVGLRVGVDDVKAGIERRPMLLRLLV